MLNSSTFILYFTKKEIQSSELVIEYGIKARFNNNPLKDVIRQ